MVASLTLHWRASDIKLFLTGTGNFMVVGTEGTMAGGRPGPRFLGFLGIVAPFYGFAEGIYAAYKPQSPKMSQVTL